MTAPAHPSSNGGYVSSEVIWLKLEHLGTTVDHLSTNLMSELRLLRTEVVRRDVYDEQRRADQTELKQLRDELARRVEKTEISTLQSDLATVKAEQRETKNRKWAVWLALIAAGLAVGKDLLSALIN